MTRRRARYRREEPQRFAQLEPGGPPPDAVFSPTYDKPADYSHLISPVHRRLGWRLRGYYIPEGAGVAAKVLLDVPNPDPRYADSLWCGKVLGDGHAHWLGLYKRNRALPRAPRETEYELGYGPRVDVWNWRFHDRGLAHAARNYLTAALGDLVARFRPASHAHFSMAVEEPDEGRFALLDLVDSPARTSESEQLELPFDQIRRLEID